MKKSNIVYTWEENGHCKVLDGFVGGGKGVVEDRFCNHIREQVPSKVRGLENAMLRVKHSSSVQHLEQVMNKIQEKKREQLSKLDHLTIEINDNNETEVRGLGDAEFLGFIKVKKTYRYMLTEDGELIRNRNLFDFMFRLKDPLKDEIIE